MKIYKGKWKTFFASQGSDDFRIIVDWRYLRRLVWATDEEVFIQLIVYFRTCKSLKKISHLLKRFQFSLIFVKKKDFIQKISLWSYSFSIKKDVNWRVINGKLCNVYRKIRSKYKTNLRKRKKQILKFFLYCLARNED